MVVQFGHRCERTDCKDIEKIVETSGSLADPIVGYQDWKHKDHMESH